MRYTLLLFMTLSLVACQLPIEKGEQAPAYMAVAAGSELLLTQNITIPANQTSVYIQYGKVTTYSGRDQYYPNCKFELYSISDMPRTVQKGSFIIKRVMRDTGYASAKLPLYAGPLSGSVGNPAAIIYSVIFSLWSQQQPDVFRLTCEHWADPLAGTDLTLDEVRKTLTPLLEIKVR